MENFESKKHNIVRPKLERREGNDSGRGGDFLVFFWSVLASLNPPQEMGGENEKRRDWVTQDRVKKCNNV